MTLALTIFGSIATAAIAAVLAHRLTSRRDQMNRRNDLRVQYLLTAYRAIADTSHRDLAVAETARAFERGLADIQLLGSKEQAGMAVAIGKALAENGDAGMDDLLLSLRDELRDELRLDSLIHPPSHARVVGGDQTG